MGATHGWLGLGAMPDGPVLWIMASDVVRYRPIVIFTGIAYVVAGPVFFLIDWMSGTPWLWTIFDSASCFALGAVILALDWRAQRSVGVAATR
jgi:hypothetical protein